jgi:type IV pilus assembly protein PilC
MKFEYIALDARGQESRGVIEASNPNEAVGQLRQAGYFPTSVTEEGKGAPAKQSKKTEKAIKAAAAPKARKGGPGFFTKKTVKGKTLMVFTRQLATLIDAGLPLLRGLTVLAKQEKDPVLRNTINSLADAVQGGSTFSESMGQHPRIFNKLYINMVKAGELGGVLELVLNRLAEFQEKAQKIKNKVVAAMAYPVIVLIIAIAIMLFLLAFIVPKFEQIFKDMLGNKPLPALTQMVIDASNLVKGNWYFLLAGVIVLLVDLHA